jgi:hypothetical protein
LTKASWRQCGVDFCADHLFFQGIPSPPLSPPLAAIADNAATTKQRPVSVAAARRGGAAYTITGECERLFCETLRAVFLVEGNTTAKDSLVMGLHYSNNGNNYTNHNHNNNNDNDDHNFNVIGRHDSVLDDFHDDLIHSSIRFGGDDDANAVAGGFADDRVEDGPALLAPDGYVEQRGLVRWWLEVFDYVGGALFRCFVVEQGDDGGGERAMFAFFDESAIVDDLKPGLMALLELCSIPALACERLVVCLDRDTQPSQLQRLTHDLGWVGFEPTTLAAWTRSDDIISDRWIFLGMEV